MADESTVKKLKEQRSQLKAKLTAARNVMFKLNECNFKSIEQTFVQVDALYEEITDVTVNIVSTSPPILILFLPIK